MVTPCGFESHLSHQKIQMPVGHLDFLMLELGLEEGDLAVGEVTKCPVDTWLARGRVYGFLNAGDSLWAEIYNSVKVRWCAKGVLFSVREGTRKAGEKGILHL